MYGGKTIFALLVTVNAVFCYQERTLPNVNSLSSLANLAQTLQLPGTQSAANGIFPQFPFQLPAVPSVQNLVALLTNISQSFSKPQSGHSNGSVPDSQNSTRMSVPQPPIYTTLPFHGLNISEFSWLFGNLSEVVNSTPTPTPTPTSNPADLQAKIFGNSGANPTYADLNFLTIPQLFNVIGG